MPRVHHIVLLQFKPGGDARVPALWTALDRLRQTLPGILHFSGGAYRSPEGLNKNFTHGFVMTFADPAARDHYLTHPDHEAVKHEFLPSVADVVAFDYEEA